MEAYSNKHQLDMVFREALVALLDKAPARPFDALAAGFTEISNRLKSNSPVSALPIRDIFMATSEHTSYEDTQAAGAGGSNDEGPHFEIPEGHTGGMFATPSRPAEPAASEYIRVRRGSVSAESYIPPASRGEARQAPVVIPKTAEQRARIEQAVSRNLLFRNLDEDQKREILDAMFERRVSKGTAVIVQGAEGDNFYVVDQGRFSVRVDGDEVIQVGAGGSFGELALMYNTKRSASVIALEDSVLWGVDRQTFRRVNIDIAYQKRMMYEDFLKSCPLLSTLNRNEISRIADALQPVVFTAGQVIIRQGDIGDRFYIVEKGEAAVRQHPSRSIPERKASQSEADIEAATEVEVGRLHVGDYFGELALLNAAPRAATVIAVTDVKCVTLSVADFIRLLGPVMDLLRRNEQLYRRYEDALKA